MRIHQLFEQGVRKIRLPVWNKFAYIELLEPQPGRLAPFGKLYDIGCPGKDIPLWQEKSSEFEAYKPITDLPEDYVQAVYDGTPWPNR